MGFNFLDGDVDQGFLLPPDMRDWVARDHLVDFIIDAVGLLDLSMARVNHCGGSTGPPAG